MRTEFERQPEACLAAWRQRYRDAPERADTLLQELLPIADALPDAPPADLPVIALSLLACQLAFEQRRAELVEPLIGRALRWAAAGREPALQPRLFGAAARVQIAHQQFDAATDLLRRMQAGIEAGDGSDRVGPAVLAHCLGMLATAQADPERALLHLRRALVLFSASGYEGPWIQVHARLAIVLRQLGQHEERRSVLGEGRRLALAQRRWGEAANLSAGLVDMALEDGDLALAERWLAEAEALMSSGGVSAEATGRLALQAARARWLAACGHFEAACALVEPQLARAGLHGGQREQLRELDELVGWKAAQGLGEQALQLSRRAHALRLQLDREAAGRQALSQRQRIELTLAETERRAHELRAAQAQAQQGRLQTALQQLQHLQEELAASRQQASMGPLLAGVAHELNTPLGNALTALSSAAEQAQGLLDPAGGAIGRQGLLGRLQALQDSQALALRGLRRALALIASYRPAMRRRPLPPRCNALPTQPGAAHSDPGTAWRCRCSTRWAARSGPPNCWRRCWCRCSRTSSAMPTQRARPARCRCRAAGRRRTPCCCWRCRTKAAASRPSCCRGSSSPMCRRSSAAVAAAWVCSSPRPWCASGSAAGCACTTFRAAAAASRSNARRGRPWPNEFSALLLPPKMLRVSRR